MSLNGKSGKYGQRAALPKEGVNNVNMRVTPNGKDSRDETPLHHAAGGDFLESRGFDFTGTDTLWLEPAACLLRHGAHPTIPDASGRTALDWAERFGPSMVDLLEGKSGGV